MCLVLVIEGIVPFLYPGRLREAALAVTRVDDRTLRLVGLASMVVGTLLLYVVH